MIIIVIIENKGIIVFFYFKWIILWSFGKYFNKINNNYNKYYNVVILKIFKLKYSM